ncbi:MAG: prepilin-type N-terminal cleavage/methylation domain-containing protein [Candidatus Daviesbacteria bacterium]|nr:prepilin-type N-terminal cleavage/methylation domain-containing protein [Candidatus Daviesbacteria bacterium]
MNNKGFILRSKSKPQRSEGFSAKRKTAGFTVIELLVVVLVIAILAITAWVVLNPPEIVKKIHDGDRLTDMADLRQAITTVSMEATQSASQVLCHNTSVPCKGSSNNDGRSANGSGWLKVSIETQKSVSMPTLPIDPLNDGNYHYAYCANGNDWELATKLESSSQANKMRGDGGNDNNLYEVGTNLNLISPTSGVCTF